MSKLSKKVLFLSFMSCIMIWSNMFYSRAEDSNSSICVEEKNIKQVKNMHEHVVKNNMYRIDSEGHFIFDIDLQTLNSYADDLSKYKYEISIMNELVDLGVAYFDENAILQVYEPSIIEKNVYDTEKENEIEKNIDFEINNQFTSISNMRRSDANQLPILRAYKIAKDNKKELRDYMTAITVTNPKGAYSSTVAIWVARVKTGGSWDYKSVNGYKPYNKRWSAIQKNTTSNKTTEWFGNYNYGFTGQLLFTKNVLLKGGDAVSYAHNGEADTIEDKNAITQGYNESVGE